MEIKMNDDLHVCVTAIFGMTFMSWFNLFWQFLSINNAAITSLVAIGSFVYMVARKKK